MVRTMFSRGEFSILVLLLLATGGFWGLWRRVLFFSWELLHVFGLLGPPLGGGTSTLDIFAVVLLSAVVFAGWVFFVARRGMPLISGPAARKFRVVTLVFVILLSLWFIGSLYWFLDMARQPAQLLTN